MKIAVSNLKGGVGKTVTAMFLAQAFTEMRIPVRVIDLDPQGSASEWASIADEQGEALGFPVVPGNVKSLKLLTRDAPDNEVILLDCPPGLAGIIDAAIDFADVALIPVSPSGMEIDRMWDIVDVATSRNVPSLILITRALKRSRLLRDLQEVLSEPDNGVVMLEPVIWRAEEIGKLFGHTPRSKDVRRIRKDANFNPLFGHDELAQRILELKEAMNG